jgi:energy-coupling factor transporter transmembrane protein EcfT
MMNEIIPILDALYKPQAMFLTLSPYISMTIVGLMIATALTLAGFILARLGYKPLWAIALIIPTLGVIAIWVLAFVKFPVDTFKQNQEHSHGHKE